MHLERCVGQRQRDAVVAIQLQVGHFFAATRRLTLIQIQVCLIFHINQLFNRVFQKDFTTNYHG